MTGIINQFICPRRSSRRETHDKSQHMEYVTLKQYKNTLIVLLSLSPSDQSTSTSPDDAEKKKANASAYRNYLNRDGPRALGSKDIPQVTARQPSDCCGERRSIV